MFIKVTRISRELTKEASQKLEEFEDLISLRLNKEPTDDNGKTLDWYKSLDLKPPKELEEKIKGNDYIELDLEEDYIIVKRSSLVNLNNILDIDSTEDEESILGSSILNMSDSSKILVEQSVEQIIEIINKTFK